MEDKSIAAAKEDSIKKYYERMLKAAEAETKRREEEEQRDRMTEDPLGQNYARWATEEEFCQSLVEVPIEGGEVERSGVPMFCRDGISYVDPSDSHTLIIGASGSKKTRLFILPSILNLCKAGESMVVTDPKAELYERTSALLKENGYKIYCINFRDDSCQNSWNPLEAPRKFFLNGKFDLAVGLLNDFATVSIAKDSRNMSDPFWDDCARATFMGLLLLLFMLSEDPEEINIRSLIRLRHTLLNDMKAKNGKNLLQELLRLAGPDSLASSYLAMVATVPEKTYASILATLDSHLLKFIIRPSLTDMLCHNDIDFHKMGEEKTAVFLVMPDEKETYHGMISIFVQQCYESLIFAAQQQENKTLKRRVNFLLDEFSSLPPIKEFPAMIAAARSRNIRFDIVVQSEKQLVSRYHEEADTIKGNCNNWIYLYSRELKTLNELSELCGVQKSGKPLVTVSKLQRLSKEQGEVLIIHGRQYPFLSHLEDISSYDHETFGTAVYEEVSPDSVRIFHIEKMVENHNEDWIIARLTQDSHKEVEALLKEEEERKRKEEEERKREEARMLEETRKAAQNALTALPWLPIQAAAPNGGAVAEANRKWYEAHRTELESAAAKITVEDICRIVKPEPDKLVQNEKHRILPASPFAANYLSMVTNLNAERIAILHHDPEKSTAAAASIYLSALFGGQMIPLYFDHRNLVSDWHKMYDRKKKMNPLLAILLTRQLFGGEMPPMPEGDLKEEIENIPDLEPEFAENVNLLLQEFNRIPKGRPEYLLIIDHMDEAKNEVDAIWQPFTLGECPNVQLVVILNAKRTDMLVRNCVSYMNYAKKINSDVSCKFVLHFNEETNEVEAKQGPAPELWIEMVEKE